MQAVIIAVHLLVALVCGCECAAACLDLRGRMPKLLMFAGLGLVHGVVPAITPSELLVAEYSENSRLQAALLALVGVVLFSGGWRLWDALRPPMVGPSKDLEAGLASPQGRTLLRRLFVCCAVGGVIAWVVSIVATGTTVREVFYRERFADRGMEEHYLAAVAQYFVILTMVPGFVGFFLPRRYRWLGIGYAVGMAILLFLASQGTRANPLGLLGGVVMGYTLRHRVSIPRALGVGLAGAAMLLLSVSLYDVRRTMARQTPLEMLSTVLSPSTYQGALVRDPLNYHEFLVAAVEYFPERHPFLNGATYRRMLVFFLPRRYFESIKPADPNMTFAEVVEPASARELTTIPPTMMGDGYINFWGWPGILVMAVNGLVFGYVHWKMRTSVLWLVAVGCMYVRVALLAVRGQPYEILLMGAWMLIMIAVLGRLCGFSFRAVAGASETTAYSSHDARRPLRKANARGAVPTA